MASNSNRRSGSSGRSTRKRVVIGAQETVRVRYNQHKPQVETEKRSEPAVRRDARLASARTGPRAGHRVSTTKRDDRERRHRAQKAKVALVGVAALAGLAIAAWAVIALWNAPIFSITSIEVEGIHSVTEAEVIDLAAVPDDATLLRVPRAEIEERVRANPWVLDVKVKRQFPGTLLITVEERSAAAVVDAGGAKLWLVSSEGVWLEQRSADATGLVTIRDVEGLEPEAGAQAEHEEIHNALRLIDGISAELRNRVRVLSASSVDKTSFITTDEVEIFVGDADRIAEKDRIALEILEREAGGVVYINVRVVERPTWRGL